MNRIVFCFIALITLVTIFSACAKSSVPQQSTGEKQRILGYLSGKGSWQAAMNAADLSLVTDLSLAFFNPDANGIMADDPELALVITAAHQKNIRVYMSIGGGSGPAYLKDFIAAPNRTTYVNTILTYAINNHFDGVDVDLENDLITDQYGAFVAELATVLKAKKLLMTAALASWNGSQIDNATLQLYDFINIMSYDKTGPWNLNKPGPHSPLSMAEDDFFYFNTTRAIPASKLLIGLPFYGYGFGGRAPQSIKYKDIITAYPGAENKDEIVLPDSGHIYYNGIVTIRQKCTLAKSKKAAGVMIWELQQDSKDEKSLLKAVAKELN